MNELLGAYAKRTMAGQASPRMQQKARNISESREGLRATTAHMRHHGTMNSGPAKAKPMLDRTKKIRRTVTRSPSIATQVSCQRRGFSCLSTISCNWPIGA